MTRNGPRAAPSLDRAVPALLAFMVVPTYEYECPKCPRIFEVKQRITEPKIEVCERCGGPIHRLLSATPFILKGGGWYVTDYPSESRKTASKSESTSGESAPAAGDSAPAAPSPAGEKSSTAKPAPSPSEKPKAEKSKSEPAAKPKASGSSSSSSSSSS
jgi:putative FmdB family regulatory protein